jgi:hypothetical protein
MSAMLRARFSASSLLNTHGPTGATSGFGLAEPPLCNLSTAPLQVLNSSIHGQAIGTSGSSSIDAHAG